jgi:HPt (histidine-containing phosphotransfer) domain-containing protein
VLRTVDALDDIDGRDRGAEIAAALERLWVRFLPEIRARVELLETAALALAGGAFSPAQRESAASAAHKLAGTLGTFSLARGTAVARELELLYSGDDEPSAETAAQMAAELRNLIEGRAQFPAN